MQPLDPLFEQARTALARGQFLLAERLAQQAIELAPASQTAWQLLADACRGQGKPQQALEVCQHLARLAPESAEAQLGLALALAEADRPEEAAAWLREVLLRWPEHAEALLQLGVLLARSGRLEEALGLLQRSARARPDHARARHNLGVALAEAGRPAEAADQFREALRLEPDYAEAAYSLGTVLGATGRADEAAACFRRCLGLSPDHFGALNNLGLALQEAGQPGEAAVLLRQAVRLRPGAEEAHNNLGLALADLGRFTEAERAYHEALRLRPGYAEAHANLGSALKELGRVEEALACYDLALRLAPGARSARYNRSLTLLQAGRWAEGWREYEQRWGRRGEVLRTFDRPRWDGAPPEGRTVLLWVEQGLGDMIQFVRYARLVQARGARVVLECPGELAPLLGSCPGIDQLVAEGEPLPPYDVQAPLMSLPMLLGTTAASVPAEVPYLSADEGRVRRWRGWLGPGRAFRVGVAWQGNPRFQWDRWRSAPLAAFAPLARVAGVELISLQKGPGAAQIAQAGFAVRDPGEGLDADGAFLDTTALLCGLDLVVCVDTAAGHLAGALGVPTWLALSAVSDWRWLRGRDDTPWYPGHRLFRQRRRGDWAGVFERMAGQLEGLARRGRGTVPVDTAAGEVADRLAILRLKRDRIKDEGKLADVRAELAALERAAAGLSFSAEALRLAERLREVNGRLWDVEDRLRACGAAADAEYARLAREVPRLNDERGELKRAISAALGSPWADQKQYGPGEGR